jgi:predicted dehydrogenase
MNPIKTVVIGMGKMGRIRCEAMKRHGGYALAAVCDVKPEAGSGYGIQQYDGWHRCLEQNRPEAVVVCAYNSVTADIVCHALEHGIHVFAEKPPGRNLAETMRMASAKEAMPDIALKFGFNHRYHESVIEAKTLVDAGLLGELVCARGVYGKAGDLNSGQWRNDPDVSGGGILLDQGIHMLDLLCYFLGNFSSVHSAVDRLVWNDMDAEDSAFAILRSEDGKRASLHSSAIQWKHKFDLDMICAEGYIALNGLLTATASYGEESITYYHKDLNQKNGKIGNPAAHTICFDHDFSWDYEMEEFYDAVRGKNIVRNGTITDAVRVMRLVEQIYKRDSIVKGLEC